MMKASFKERLFAYVIDTFIVAIIISIISVGFSTTRIEKLNDEASELSTSYIDGEISSEECIGEYVDIYYDLANASVVSNVVYLVVCVGYFVCFQYLNGGASIGKKLMRIRVVSNNKGDVSFLQMVIRTSIVNEIIPMLLMILLVFVSNGFTFFACYSIIGFAYNLFVITCVVMILCRKDMLALHDVMSRSMVIREDI